MSWHINQLYPFKFIHIIAKTILNKFNENHDVNKIKIKPHL